jgi:starvation-inducible DNA-binding protein
MNPPRSQFAGSAMTELLRVIMIDMVDMQLQSKQARWNVKPPRFIALDELFGKLNEDMEFHVDLLAERIVQLGGYADGSCRTIASRSSLPEYPRVQRGSENVAALSLSLSLVSEKLRSAGIDARYVGDEHSATILIELSRCVDKWLWFLESHLDAT